MIGNENRVASSSPRCWAHGGGTLALILSRGHRAEPDQLPPQRPEISPVNFTFYGKLGSRLGIFQRHAHRAVRTSRFTSGTC